MMDGEIYIVVEGEEDLRFLEGYLGFLGHAFKSGCCKALGGKDNLGDAMPGIEQTLDQGTEVLIILDANGDCTQRRKEVKKVLNKYCAALVGARRKREFKMRLDNQLHLFLFPDNQSKGTLETLLEKIIISEHKGIFGCFKDYVKCLNEKKNGNTLPHMKGKIYAYEQAVGALKEKEKRFNPQYWDFDNSALEPLKEFLTKHISV